MKVYELVYPVPLAESQAAATFEGWERATCSDRKFYETGLEEFNMIAHYT